MVAYLDSSAAVKLAHREPHTQALGAWLSALTEPRLVSSALLEIELYRAIRRSDPDALPRVAGVLSRFVRLEIDAAIRRMAVTYDLPLLRSLDAIHLATAMTVAEEGGLDLFVAYDTKLLAFATQQGLRTLSPGQ